MRKSLNLEPRQNISFLNLDIEKWSDDWLYSALTVIWEGYEKLVQHYKTLNINAFTESEEEITFSLLQHINIVKNFSPTYFSLLRFNHETPHKEGERNRKRKSNDLGIYFGIEIDRPEFVLEAKKIKTLTPSGIQPYLEDLNAFLTAYYVPNLSQSGLIAYLHVENSAKFFELAEKCIGEQLSATNAFGSHPHRISKHQKTIEKTRQENFLCHHLAFDLY